MIKCINDFTNMRDAELVKKAANVSMGMTNNPAFTDPVPTIEALNTATDQFNEAMIAAESRDKMKVVLKQEKQKLLNASLSQLLSYVNAKANGDKAMLVSSNFTLGKEGRSTQTLGSFDKAKATPGKNSGEVLVSYSSVDNAVSYEVEFAVLPMQDDNWEHVSEPTTKCLLTGLIRGKEYNIRVVAIGRRKQITYSQVMTILVV